ncbi:hypothetical protein Q7C36_014631 [Tachysurus vachellii]|uniref:Uncharacterized protein n=1 Tax=Tachysurus vachellii TaxID=175792 RepID=A0AA88MFI1_TACVA|nr:hypothetical protein Q7C36_014631 [Tachysurus vachellii]
MEGKDDKASKESRTEDTTDENTRTEDVSSSQSSDSDVLFIDLESPCEVETPKKVEKAEDDTESLLSMNRRSAPESQQCSDAEENDPSCVAGASGGAFQDCGNSTDSDNEAQSGTSVPKKPGPILQTTMKRMGKQQMQMVSPDSCFKVTGPPLARNPGQQSAIPQGAATREEICITELFDLEEVM